MIIPPELAQKLMDMESEGPRESFKDQFQEPTKLVEAMAFITKPKAFTKGQFVRCPALVNNRKWPKVNHPAIIVNVLDTPAETTDDQSSAYHTDVLDVEIGILDADGVFECFLFPSARLEEYPEDELKEYVTTMLHNIAIEEERNSQEDE